MNLLDLNLARLDDITGGDPQMNGEMVSIVLEDAQSTIESLLSALDEWDVANGSARAHQLKGLCGNVGAELLADIALRLERTIERGDRTAALALRDDVVAAFARLRTVAASL